MSKQPVVFPLSLYDSQYVPVKPIKVENSETASIVEYAFESIHAAGMRRTLNSSHKRAIIEVTAHGYGVGRLDLHLLGTRRHKFSTKGKIRYEAE